MATTAERIVVAGIARIYVAPLGTPAPTDEAQALNASWIEVGFTVPDGTSFTVEPSFEEIPAHQSDYPVRTLKTGSRAVLNSQLQEWSKSNFQAAFGGGIVTSVGAGKFKYSPPGPASSTDVSAIAQVEDGTKRYRIVIPRARATDSVELPLNKAAVATLGLALVVQGSDASDPWYLLTNDAAFA